jgi:hypothetical protein
MNNDSLIIALSILGLSLIAAFVAIIVLYTGDKGIAIAGLVTVAGLIIPQLLSLKASTENAAKLESVGQKIDTNTAITQNVEQVAHETHLAVNSRMDELIARVEEQGRVQGELKAALALKEGIAVGREQMGAHPDEAKP